MKIKEIYISGFGKLNDFRLEFNEGYNKIIENNGFGKTTIADFISAMFYGLPNNRSNDISINLRKKYAPWNHSNFGGTMTIEYNGKDYRIERKFSRISSGDRLTVYDLQSAEKTEVFGSDIGFSIFGIDRDAFIRCIYMPQINAVNNNCESIANKLSATLNDTDNVKADTAIELLSDWRRKLEKPGQKGYVYELKDKELDLKQRIYDAQIQLKEIDELTSEADKYDKQYNDLKENISYAEIAVEADKLDKERQAVKEEYENALNNVKRSQNIIEQADYIKAEIEKIKIRKEKYNIDIKNEEIKRDNISYVLQTETLEEVCKQKKQKVDDFKKVYTVSPESDSIPKIEQAIADKDKYKKNIEEIDIEINKTRNQIGETLSPNKPSPLFVIFIILTAILGVACISLYFVNIIRSIFVLIAAGLFIIAAIVFIILQTKVSKQYKAIFTKYKNELDLLNNSLEEQNKTKLEYLAKINDCNSIIESTLNSIGIINYESISDILVKIKADMIREKDLNEDYNSANKAYQEFIEEHGDEIKSGRQFNGQMLEQLKQGLKKADNDIEKKNNDLNEIAAKKATVSAMEEQSNEYKKKYDALTLKFNELADKAGLAMESINKQEQLKQYRDELSTVSELAIKKRTEKDEKKKNIEDISDLANELENTQKKLKIYSDKLSNVKLAIDLLEKAEKSLAGNYIPNLKNNFLKYLDKTNLKFESQDINNNFNIILGEQGSGRDISCFSTGTKELIYFCLRMSLMESMYTDKLPLMIIDDCFNDLDENNYSIINSIVMEKATETQIIYMSCYR